MQKRLKTARRLLILAVVVVLGAVIPALPALAAPGPSFTNPLVGTPNSADPSVVYSGGYWYYVATTWSSRIIMRKSATMAGLKTAAEQTVFTLSPGPGCCTMWAPDLQWINNRWYLYFSAEASPGQGERRTGVLESAGPDPLGPYTYRGILNLEPNDGWAIDGSLIRFNGYPNHFVYSAFRGGEQGLFIAPMSSPTQVSRNGVRISSPTLSWERQGSPVNEGPYAVYNAGKTFLTYSASSCQTPDYKLGMLSWTGGDPMSPSSWTKKSTPIFQRSDANGVYGPGHASFVQSPDNTETWVVYHANSSASQGCGTTRTTRAQKISFNSDGSPNLGVPVRTGTTIEGPSGDSNASSPTAYRLNVRHSGKAMDVQQPNTDNGARIGQYTYGGNAWQQWQFQDAGSGYWRIVSQHSGKCLDVVSASTADGAELVQYTCGTGTNQQFQMVATGSYFQLRARHSGKCVDVPAASTSDGVILKQYPCNTGTNQQWSRTTI